MPKITFTQKFDWTDPRAPMVTTAYKAGHTYMVTTPCATAAIAKGKATPFTQPVTTPEPEQVQDAESSVSG